MSKTIYQTAQCIKGWTMFTCPICFHLPSNIGISLLFSRENDTLQSHNAATSPVDGFENFALTVRFSNLAMKTRSPLIIAYTQ
jgi:hypothetical protein